MPLYVLGFMGATRRMNHYDTPRLAAVHGRRAGRCVDHLDGRCCSRSLRSWSACVKRNSPAYKDVTGDPWNGRTLEWATSSPPPVYNFAVMPVVHELDAFAHMKERGRTRHAAERLSRHPHAAQHERRFDHRLVQPGDWFCAGLAHLVARHRRVCWAWSCTLIVRSYDDDIDYTISAANRRRHGRHADAHAPARTLRSAGGTVMLQKTIPLRSDRDRHDDHGASNTVFGFWVYLMTDCIIFASLFAVFAVMGHQFAGGPTGQGPLRASGRHAGNGHPVAEQHHVRLRHAGRAQGQVGRAAGVARRDVPARASCLSGWKSTSSAR